MQERESVWFSSVGCFRVFERREGRKEGGKEGEVVSNVRKGVSCIIFLFMCVLFFRAGAS